MSHPGLSWVSKKDILNIQIALKWIALKGSNPIADYYLLFILFKFQKGIDNNIYVPFYSPDLIQLMSNPGLSWVSKKDILNIQIALKCSNSLLGA